MTDPTKTSFPIPEPQNNAPKPNQHLSNGGCFVNFLFLIGVMVMLYGTAGYIAGLFDYELKIKGSSMGLVDLPVYLGLLGAGIIFLGLGFLFRFIGKMIGKRKENRKL